MSVWVEYVRARGAFIAVCAALCSLSACSGEGPTPSDENAASDLPPALTEISPEQHARIEALAADWPTEPSYIVGFNALDPSSNPIEEVRASLFDPDDPFWGLPEAEGRNLVVAYCGACHSLRLVMQQSMVETGWDATLTRMVADRGMPEVQADIRQSILSYLTEHFGSGG